MMTRFVLHEETRSANVLPLWRGRVQSLGCRVEFESSVRRTYICGFGAMVSGENQMKVVGMVCGGEE